MQLTVIMLAVVLSLSGVFMGAIGAFATSAYVSRHRTRVDRPTRIDASAHLKSRVINSIVSTGMVVAVTLGFGSRLFATAPVSALRTVAEAAAILALYDLGYYFLHRFAFHSWSVGRRVHSVHHSIRTPYANDSLYIHPAETAAGVGLFLGCAALIGPVGLASFGLAFLAYSVLNLYIHSSVELPFFPFNILSGLVRHHDIHHESMKSGYYASITPIWDVIFRTARRP